MGQLLTDGRIGLLGNQPPQKLGLALLFQTLAGTDFHLQAAHAETADEHDNFRGRVRVDPQFERLQKLPSATDNFEVVGIPDGLLQGRFRLGAGIPERSHGRFPHGEV